MRNAKSLLVRFHKSGTVILNIVSIIDLWGLGHLVRSLCSGPKVSPSAKPAIIPGRLTKNGERKDRHHQAAFRCGPTAG